VIIKRNAEIHFVGGKKSTVFSHVHGYCLALNGSSHSNKNLWSWT